MSILQDQLNKARSKKRGRRVVAKPTPVVKVEVTPDPGPVCPPRVAWGLKMGLCLESALIMAGLAPANLQPGASTGSPQRVLSDEWGRFNYWR